MNLRLLVFDGCPHAAAARSVAHAAASTYPGLTVEEVTVKGPAHAAELGFRGSPSFELDGADLFADPEAPVAFVCRSYASRHGAAGCPTAEQVIAAIARVLDD